jgi:hypothetical protein
MKTKKSMRTRDPSKQHNLLLAAAAVLIVGSLSVYCLMLYRWLGEKPAAVAFPPKPPAQASDELAAARARFREGFLEPSSRLRLAEVLYGQGRAVDAFYVLRETRRFFGEEVFRRAHERIVLHKDPYLGDADFDPSPANQNRLEDKLKSSPNDADTLTYLAHIATEGGDQAQALKYAEAGLLARPTDLGLMLLKADVTSAGDLMGAIPLYARLANAAPASFEGRRALETLGKFSQKKEADPQAEAGRLAQEALEELFKAQPKEPMVFAALALSAWNRGEPAAARALCAETLTKDPHHAGALMVDGLIAMSDKDADRALKSFSAAWSLNPNDFFSAAQLARLYDRERGDRESALPYYIALYRQNPDYGVGEPVEGLIQEIVDTRAKALVEQAPVESLARFFNSDDASLRAQACVRASLAQDPRWIDQLADLLDDDTEAVRHDADYALYQLARKSPDGVRQRRDVWLASPRPLLHTRALNLFADLYPDETFPFVAQSLRSPSPVVRFLTSSILERYYKNTPAGRKARADYMAEEQDPGVLAQYARWEKMQGQKP